MWSNKEDKIMTINFIFGPGFFRRHTQRLQASRRQLLVSEEKGLSLVRRILSQIDEDNEDDDFPKGILEDSKLVKYIYNCMVHLPKELDTLDVSFSYSDDVDRFLVISRWIVDNVEKPLDDIKDEQVCPVCLEDIRIGNRVIYLSCKHVFHPFCIAKWGYGKASSSCPLCRFPFAGYFESLSFNVLYHDDDYYDNHACTNTRTGLQSIVQNYASDDQDDDY